MNLIYFKEYETAAPFIAIGLTIIGFISYYTIIKSKAIASKFSQSNFIYFSRISGFALFGIIPLIVFYFLLRIHLAEIGLATQQVSKSIVLIVVLTVITILISFILAKKTTNLQQYPQIRTIHWGVATFLFSSFTWIAYLIGYEFLFRGVLLFSCIKAFGIVPAIAINIILYALVHLPKGKIETIGAILVGLIFCLITQSTGTIWIALWIHIVMALSNEWFSFYHHPTMHFQLQNKRL